MWSYIVVVAVLAVGLWGFVTVARFATRFLSRRTDRTAESMYEAYRGPPKRPRRRKH